MDKTNKEIRLKENQISLCKFIIGFFSFLVGLFFLVSLNPEKTGGATIFGVQIVPLLPSLITAYLIALVGVFAFGLIAFIQINELIKKTK